MTDKRDEEQQEYDINMKINMLMVIAIVFLGVTILSYSLRVLTMIELWQISIALLAVSFGAWFEVHSKYSDEVKQKKKKKLEKVRAEIGDICKIFQSGKHESEIEEKLVHLTALYEESNQPISLFEQTWNAFSYAGVLFLISLFSRVGVDLLLLSQLSTVEALTFLVGVFFFILALWSTRSLMNLLSSDKDPITSMFRIAVIAIVQALHSYLIWQLSLNPVVLTTSHYFLIFYILLWFTFVGSAILWMGIEDRTMKKLISGIVLIYAPWIWLVIIAGLLRIGLMI